MGEIRIVGGDEDARTGLRAQLAQAQEAGNIAAEWQLHLPEAGDTGAEEAHAAGSASVDDRPTHSGPIARGPVVALCLGDPDSLSSPAAACWRNSHARLQLIPHLSQAAFVAARPVIARPTIDAIWQSPVGVPVSVDHDGSVIQEDALTQFGQWLNLGLELARARHGAHQTRHVLARALMESENGLATEIHNGPIQELVGATFMLGMVPDGLGDPALAQIEAALHRLRAICQTLKPPALYDFGLAPALRTALKGYAQKHSEFAPTVNKVDFDPDLPTLSAFPRMILFAITDRILTALLAGDGLTIGEISLKSTPMPTARVQGDAAQTMPNAVCLKIGWQVDGAMAHTPQSLEAVLPVVCELAYAVHGDLVMDEGMDVLSRGMTPGEVTPGEVTPGGVTVWVPAPVGTAHTVLD